MNPLWTKIGLGALGVFTVGMVGATVVHRASDTVSRKLESFVAPPAQNTAVDGITPTMVELAAEPMARLAGLRTLMGKTESTNGHRPFRCAGRCRSGRSTRRRRGWGLADLKAGASF